MQLTIFRVVQVFVFFLVAFPAHAYIGPGVGAGAIAVVLGVFAAVGMAFVAVFWFPVKRLLKKHKAKKETGSMEPGERTGRK